MRFIGFALAACILPIMPAAAQTAPSGQAAAAPLSPHQQQARAIFERLITFRTAQGQGQVPAMVEYIAETLRAGGVPAEDIAILPLDETAGMLVRIPGSDPAARPILFSGHMDVVDARPEDWERNPFQLIEENGYFFGRGTGDNKAGITSMVSTILRLRADGHRPRRTLVFGFVGDEETTFGTTRLITAHDWVRNAEYAINTDAGGGSLSEEGRPTGYWVQGAEKAYASFKLTIRNQGGHSSRPRPDNAIYDLAQALLRIQSIRHPIMTNELTLIGLRQDAATEGGEKGRLLSRFADDPADEEALAILTRDPMFLVDVSTTCVATMLSAGHAENALPQRAEATVNCRIFPGDSVAAVLGRLNDAVANPEAVIEVMGNPAVSPVSEPRPDVMAAIARSVHRRHPGLAITPYQEAGATDGLIYRTAGIPTYASSGVFIRGSDIFYHGLNERIPVASFYSAVDHIHDLAVELGGE